MVPLVEYKDLLPQSEQAGNRQVLILSGIGNEAPEKGARHGEWRFTETEVKDSFAGSNALFDLSSSNPYSVTHL